MAKPEVTKVALSGIQVCVPREFDDEQVLEFAQNQTPDMQIPYRIQRDGDTSDPERVQCSQHPENCHIVLLFG